MLNERNSYNIFVSSLSRIVNDNIVLVLFNMQSAIYWCLIEICDLRTKNLAIPILNVIASKNLNQIQITASYELFFSQTFPFRESEKLWTVPAQYFDAILLKKEKL